MLGQKRVPCMSPAGFSWACLGLEEARTEAKEEKPSLCPGTFSFLPRAVLPLGGHGESKTAVAFYMPYCVCFSFSFLMWIIYPRLHCRHIKTHILYSP